MSKTNRPAALSDLVAAETAAIAAEHAALVAYGAGSPEAHAAWLASSAAFRAVDEALAASRVAS